jgi:hypothetical protein
MTPSALRINHFALLPGEGGGTRHFDTARELTRRDWSPVVIAADFHSPSRRYTRREGEADIRALPENGDGVDFHWLWYAPYATNDWRRAWNWLSLARSLLRWQKQADRPGLIIGSTPHLFAALANRRMASLWKVPVVLEVRDLWPESMVAAGGRRVRRITSSTGSPSISIAAPIGSSAWRAAPWTIWSASAGSTRRRWSSFRTGWTPRRSLTLSGPSGIRSPSCMPGPTAPRTASTWWSRGPGDVRLQRPATVAERDGDRPCA